MFDSSNGNFDIQKSHINDKGYFVVTAGETNNGILGKSDVEARIFEANTITIDMFGFAFFRQFEYKMVTHARVFSLKPKFKTTHKQGLFLASLFKHLKTKFGYDNMCSWAKIKDDKIQLPINRDGDIDFEFMESFVAELEAERVAELEAERVAELEAYLAAASLKDYELTADELSALSKFENYNWGEFEYRKIFNHIKQGKRLKKDDQICGDLPFVMAGITNNGVANYISNPIIMFPKNSITVDIFGNVFYRDFEFSAGDDTGVYWNDEREFSKEIMLFFATAMSKSLLGKYSFGNKLRSSKSFNIAMELPTNNGEIDFEFMNNFIKAIEKLVIKDVVLYSDNKIKATKSIVSSNQ
ncbi:type I restriction/modification system, S subunit [Campylobacter vicugnae]|uniref:Type I restriction/modification system, S subunit n=1 Tax=Campylobacter vicugnae TaxID=1660076 RepID=A0A1X9T041_9BACT|nr:restriction endonuclease subunit S [Campylobacter sp. RM8964]ARR01825.1 type I restriction/modification system, S subunit [Campylobacter sp. RM8964]